MADYNPATKAYDTINYTSIPKLAALLPYSNSTLNRILVNDEYKDMIKEYGLVEIDANDSIHKKQVFFRDEVKKVLAKKGIIL